MPCICMVTDSKFDVGRIVRKVRHALPYAAALLCNRSSAELSTSIAPKALGECPKVGEVVGSGINAMAWTAPHTRTAVVNAPVKVSNITSSWNFVVRSIVLHWTFSSHPLSRIRGPRYSASKEEGARTPSTVSLLSETLEMEDRPTRLTEMSYEGPVTHSSWGRRAPPRLTYVLTMILRPKALPINDKPSVSYPFPIFEHCCFTTVSTMFADPKS